MARVKVDFTFLLMNALMFLTGDSGMILGFYAVCAVHEIGHITALCISGGKLRRIELTGLGIKMTAYPMPGIFRNIAVLLSGPLVNIAVWLILELTGRTGEVSRLSLLAGLYNMLPFPFLDGGAAVDILTAGRGSAARIIMSLVLAAAVVILFCIA